MLEIRKGYSLYLQHQNLNTDVRCGVYQSWLSYKLVCWLWSWCRCRCESRRCSRCACVWRAWLGQSW